MFHPTSTQTSTRLAPNLRRGGAGNSIALIPTMNRIVTANKRIWALIVLLASTLLSYAKILGIVVSERLWRIPQRQLRIAGDVNDNASRRLP